MKKSLIVAALACVAALAAAGCGEGREMSDEERFNAAKDKFGNYTVEVQVNLTGGYVFESVLKVDGAAAVYIEEEDGYEVYYKEDDGIVYVYEDGWQRVSGSSVEEATAEETGYVYLVENLFFDDLEKQDDGFAVSDEALAGYSEQYGMELSSCRIKLSGSEMASAVVVVNFSGERMEISYAFKDYGKTSVTLPE